MKTALDLTPEELEDYRTAARRRHAQKKQALAQREQRAWELARRAAALLRAQFGVTRVKVFGSLAHEGYFTPWSDVDIAAWDIRMEDTLRAIGAVMDISSDIQVNLVDVNICSTLLLESIEREGIEL